MKEKNEIIKKFKSLVSDLKKHNKFYYLKDSPKISDSEYISRLLSKIFEIISFAKIDLICCNNLL